MSGLRKLGVALLLVAIVAGLSAWLFGIKRIRAGVEPSTDLYGEWDALLTKHVHPDGVDYEGLKADEATLRRVVATFEEVGPKSTPDRFADRDHELAYYVNAYNALTLLGVVEHHPVSSIQDVHGLIEPKPGFGFFWGLRFGLDGRSINLYDLENSIIRGYDDARIHAAINCASASCPTLSSRAYRPETLSDQLDAATRAFVGSDTHVRSVEGAVELSSIFTWFRGDFESHATTLGLEGSTLAWIEHYSADPTRREAAANARQQGHELRYVDYDWSLNARP